MACSGILIIQAILSGWFDKVSIEAQAFKAQVAATVDRYGSNCEYKDCSVAGVVWAHSSVYREKMTSLGLLSFTSSHGLRTRQLPL